MKPVDADKLREAVSQIEAQLGTFPEDGTETPGKLVVHTFGNFEVLYNGTPLVFEREKAKELLALLIDRQGLSMTNGEIEAFCGRSCTRPNICKRCSTRCARRCAASGLRICSSAHVTTPALM